MKEIKWISVEKSLPKEKQEILIFLKNKEILMVSSNGDDFSDYDASHWMPLPTPPGRNDRSENEYLKKKDIVARYPFSLGQVNFFFLRRHRNGLNKAIFKVGKHLVIRADLFEEWIEGQK